MNSTTTTGPGSAAAKRSLQSSDSMLSGQTRGLDGSVEQQESAEEPGKHESLNFKANRQNTDPDIDAPPGDGSHPADDRLDRPGVDEPDPPPRDRPMPPEPARPDLSVNAPARTVVVRAHYSTVRLRLNAAIGATRVIWNRAPRPVRNFLCWWVQPRVLCCVGFILLAAAVISYHYYRDLAAQIDSRLNNSTLDDSVQILSSPMTIATGDRISIPELTSYLISAGYTSKVGEQDRSALGSFSVTPAGVDVTPSLSKAAATTIPVRVEIKGGRVSSLVDLDTHRRTSSVALQPTLLATLKEGDRSRKIDIPFSQLPEVLIHAITAAEDRRFFTHSGIDWRGVCRALWVDLRDGEVVQGGSTITQQLIKNSFLTPERSWERKIKEAAMALILESRLSKEEIFAYYANNVYLGHSGGFAIHGVGQAARVYFEKNPGELTVAEAAFLAGLIRAPNRYSPQRDQSRALERRNQVLDSMAEVGSISRDEAQRARAEPVTIRTRQTNEEAGTGYFVDYAERFVDETSRTGSLSSDLVVYTTLDPALQRAACDSIRRNTDRLDRTLNRKRNKHAAPANVQAALVAIDPHNGDVLAMVGGRNYDESQLNRATDAWRQPGSAFKPFVYAAAFKNRACTAATLLSDRPTTFAVDEGRAEYRPADYGGGYSYRDVSVANAFARSLNVPAVELAQQVGTSVVASLAAECGLPKPNSYPSMALGTSEVTLIDLAAAYTAFANQGIAVRPRPVKRIGEPDGFVANQITTSSYRPLSPQVAYLMTHLMSSVINRGTAARVRAMGFKEEAAGKTGTSRDGWFVGYTPNLVCAVWVGYDDNRDLEMTGSESALPIWVDFMKRALEIHPGLGGRFVQPLGLTSVVIDPSTGLLASEECSGRAQELFISGTEPLEVCRHSEPSTDEPTPDGA
ncbi:MAG TPA: PBP1A family penicillin-binding protein, partial [Blastocatellia bacterium]|nr:PBP1A family penicillin-binding protein [Blastocatellia bacterium]